MQALRMFVLVSGSFLLSAGAFAPLSRSVETSIIGSTLILSYYASLILEEVRKK